MIRRHVATRQEVTMCPVCNERPRQPGYKTCGARCGYELRKQSVKPRPCPTCGELFRPYPSVLVRASGKFCSRACYLKVVNQRPAMIEVPCLACGMSFRRTAAAIKRVRRSFCSNECRVRYTTGERHHSWRGGHDPNRGPGWHKLAAEMRARDGYRCRMCGKSEADNGQKLSVDHIIPWRHFDDAGTANEAGNLASLCRPCHAKKARAERLWLQGDVLDMWRYQIAVSSPWPSRR